MNLRNFARLWLPAILLNAVRRLRYSCLINDKIRFVGDYGTWAQAEQASVGYSAPNILERTRSAMLKVKNGEAPYARDAVVFDELVCPFPVLAGLLRARSAADNRLSVSISVEVWEQLTFSAESSCRQLARFAGASSSSRST